MELDDSGIGPRATVLLPRSTEAVDWTVANEILQDGLSSWKKTNEIIKHHDGGVVTTARWDANAVDDLAAAATWGSDLAVLRELGCSGVPWLSGACRGFGFDFIACAPSSTAHEKSKRYDRRLRL
jgi:hypothetical protein